MDGAPWTLTALIPRDFPLGRDDYRPTCVEFEYRGQTRRVCANDPQSGDFTRINGDVFAYGIVPRSALDLALETVDRGHGEHGLVATLHSSAASGTTWRFFAAQLPAANCGVAAYDVTSGRHKAVATATSFPDDGLPCNHPLPNARTPLTTAPPH
ncbi:MAG TPA: hypothetical protein VGI86_00405 [Acidimicrobiia bacterium]